MDSYASVTVTTLRKQCKGQVIIDHVFRQFSLARFTPAHARVLTDTLFYPVCSPELLTRPQMDNQLNMYGVIPLPIH